MAQKTGFPTIVETCPRCGTHETTLDVRSAASDPEGGPRSWVAFVVCRRCRKPSLFDMRASLLEASPAASDWAGNDINHIYQTSPTKPVIRAAAQCPEYVPVEIAEIFDEAAHAVAFSAFNAAGAMFRKAIDVATRGRIGIEPQSVDRQDPNYISWKVAKDLRLRLDWLFERDKLPEDLKELVSCVHQDGNDAAHSDETIGQEGALDLQDFTMEILETIYTRPGQIAANISRRDARRAS